MRPKTVTLSSQTTSAPIPIDHRAPNIKITLGCDVLSSGVLVYDVQYTFDDIGVAGYNPSTGNWQTHPILTGKAVSDASNLAFPVRAVRLRVTSYTSGSIRLTILQSSTQ